MMCNNFSWSQSLPHKKVRSLVSPASPSGVKAEGEAIRVGDGSHNPDPDRVSFLLYQFGRWGTGAQGM